MVRAPALWGILATLLLLPPAGLAADEGGPAFLRTDEVETLTTDAPSSCPIRVEIPLSPLVDGRKTLWEARARVIHCNGARVTGVRIERAKQRRGTTRGLEVASWVSLPEGNDQRIDIRYQLRNGDDEHARATDSLPGDEGEGNWGRPIFLAAPADLSNATLRVEVSFQPR